MARQEIGLHAVTVKHCRRGNGGAVPYPPLENLLIVYASYTIHVRRADTVQLPGEDEPTVQQNEGRILIIEDEVNMVHIHGVYHIVYLRRVRVAIGVIYIITGVFEQSYTGDACVLLCTHRDTTGGTGSGRNSATNTLQSSIVEDHPSAPPHCSCRCGLFPIRRLQHSICGLYEPCSINSRALIFCCTTTWFFGDTKPSSDCWRWTTPVFSSSYITWFTPSSNQCNIAHV